MSLYSLFASLIFFMKNKIFDIYVIIRYNQDQLSNL